MKLNRIVKFMRWRLVKQGGKSIIHDDEINCIRDPLKKLDDAMEIVEKLARLSPVPWMLTLMNWNYFGVREYSAMFRSSEFANREVTERATEAARAITLAADAVLKLLEQK